MKDLSICVCLVTLLILGPQLLNCKTAEPTKYTTKYDNVDLEDIVKSDRLLKNYVDCVLDKGPCTPDGSELRKAMPDAIETNCTKCSDKQKEGSDYIINFLIDNKPDMWKLLQDKYDPDGTYKQRYLATKKSELNIEPVHT